jgi:hypothetical protein
MSAIELLLVLLFAVPTTRSAQQVSEADLASRRRPPSCSQSVGKKGESEELDVSAILWRTHSNTERYFGKPTKVSAPTNPIEGWLFYYKNGNSTVGTKNQVLQVNYRFKIKPRDWRDALKRMGISPTAEPVLLGPTTSYTWASKGTKPAPLQLCGTNLNLVILYRDLSEITVMVTQNMAESEGGK